MIFIKSKPKAVGVDTYISRKKVDFPKHLGPVRLVKGSSNAWIDKNILVEDFYESCEQEDVIELRDIPIEQIKEEMLSLLSDGITRYADEIAAELRLDIMDVIEAFNQLQEEGKLFVDKNKL